jgi:acetate kinase
MEKEIWATKQPIRFINKHSGMSLGLTGIPWIMREIEAAESQGKARARLPLDIFRLPD